MNRWEKREKVFDCGVAQGDFYLRKRGYAILPCPGCEARGDVSGSTAREIVQSARASKINKARIKRKGPARGSENSRGRGDKFLDIHDSSVRG